MTNNQIVASDNLRADLGKNMKRLKALLPANVPVERFCSVAIIAAQNNPALLLADRQTLLNELLKCASDGLIPDNREATLQIYKTKIDNKWVKKVQYLPMVRGIIKKMRTDPNIQEIIVEVAYSNDEFEVILGSESNIIHKPTMSKDRGEFVCAYAILKYKDGRKHSEIMRSEDVAKARAVAKTDMVWAKWFDEKAKSSVLHRAEKRLDRPYEEACFMQNTLKAEIAEEVMHDVIDVEPNKRKEISENLESFKKNNAIENKADAVELKQGNEKLKPKTTDLASFKEENTPESKHDYEKTEDEVCKNCKGKGVFDDIDENGVVIGIVKCNCIKPNQKDLLN